MVVLLMVLCSLCTINNHHNHHLLSTIHTCYTVLTDDSNSSLNLISPKTQFFPSSFIALMQMRFLEYEKIFPIKIIRTTLALLAIIRNLEVFTKISIRKIKSGTRVMICRNIQGKSNGLPRYCDSLKPSCKRIWGARKGRENE